MFPLTIEEYLPEDHLAWLVVEIVEQLDLITVAILLTVKK